MVSIVSLYVFTKMLEGVIYNGYIIKVDSWINQIIYPSEITGIASFITRFGSATAITLLFIGALTALLLRKR